MANIHFIPTTYHNHIPETKSQVNDCKISLPIVTAKTTLEVEIEYITTSCYRELSGPGENFIKIEYLLLQSESVDCVIIGEKIVSGVGIKSRTLL